MILTQSEIERERYEARLKAQLDQNTVNTMIKGARLEGEKLGIIQNIQFCERVLKKPETPTEQLAVLALEDLARLVKSLQEQVMARL